MGWCLYHGQHSPGWLCPECFPETSISAEERRAARDAEENLRKRREALNRAIDLIFEKPSKKEPAQKPDKRKDDDPKLT